MGNKIKSFQKHELQYYSTVTDDNYTCAEVYTCPRLPTSFIVRVKLSPAEETLFRQYSQEDGRICRSLVTLYSVIRQKECQCKHFLTDALVSYWEYYNYDLNKLLQKRLNHKMTFSEEEVWHLVKVCCEGYLALRHNNIFYDFSPQKIAVTPEGKLKLSWSHVTAKNTHLNFLSFFESRCQNLPAGYYSPEELREIANRYVMMRHRQRNLRLNFEKCNVFSFGMLLMHCMTMMDPLKYFYVQYTVDLSAVRKAIRQKLNGLYSVQIVNLLEACLIDEPENRLNFEQIANLYGPRFEQNSSVMLIIHTGSQSKAETEIADRKSTHSRISLRKKHS